MADAVPTVVGQPELRADCGRCFGLCCVALAFTTSIDFAVDKDAGEPCHHLRPDDGCEIHPVLRASGFKGCTVFDCFGAGQQVSQVTFGGKNWRESEDDGASMFAVFSLMRQVHEMLFYLHQAVALGPSGPLEVDLRRRLEETAALTTLPGQDLIRFDLDSHRDEVNLLLGATSQALRAEVPRSRAQRGNKRIRRGGELMGANLAGVDLSGADLRGAYLIAADLRGATLFRTDVIGADLRDADLRGADLSQALFLTQVQANSAKGDGSTELPTSISRPPHWV